MKYFGRSFIFLFVSCTFFLSVYAGTQLWHKTMPPISWLGLFLSSAPVWTFAFLNRANPQKLDAAHAFVVSCVCGAGLAISMASSWKHGEAAGVVHLGSGACVLAWMLYLKWCKARSGTCPPD